MAAVPVEAHSEALKCSEDLHLSEQRVAELETKVRELQVRLAQCDAVRKHGERREVARGVDRRKANFAQGKTIVALSCQMQDEGIIRRTDDVHAAHTDGMQVAAAAAPAPAAALVHCMYTSFNFKTTTIAHCSVPMLTSPSDEPCPSPCWCCATPAPSLVQAMRSAHLLDGILPNQPARPPRPVLLSKLRQHLRDVLAPPSAPLQFCHPRSSVSRETVFGHDAHVYGRA